MNWYKEQRKRLYEEFNSGKMTEEKFRERINAHDAYYYRTTNEPERISNSRTSLIISLVLISFFCYFMFVDEFTMNTEQSASTVSERIFGAPDSELIKLYSEDSSQHIGNANISETYENEIAPFVLTNENKYDPEVIRALIEAWADNYYANTTGEAQPLFVIEKTDPEAVIAFMKAVANLNENDALDKTSLLSAMANHFDPKIVTALLNAGVSTDVGNYSDITAKVNARRNRVNIYDIQDIRRKVTENANRNATATNVNRNAPEVNPNRNAANVNRNAPATKVVNFVDLCKNGSVMQISEAIRNGANVNSSFGGMTPLMAAAAFSNPEVISLLIKAGAIVDREAVDYAIRYGRNSNLIALGVKNEDRVSTRKPDSVPTRKPDNVSAKKTDDVSTRKPNIRKKPNSVSTRNRINIPKISIPKKRPDSLSTSKQKSVPQTKGFIDP